MSKLTLTSFMETKLVYFSKPLQILDAKNRVYLNECKYVQ